MIRINSADPELRVLPQRLLRNKEIGAERPSMSTSRDVQHQTKMNWIGMGCRSIEGMLSPKEMEQQLHLIVWQEMAISWLPHCGSGRRPHTHADHMHVHVHARMYACMSIQTWMSIRVCLVCKHTPDHPSSVRAHSHTHPSDGHELWQCCSHTSNIANCIVRMHACMHR